MPRYSPDQVVHLNSGGIESATTSLLRAPRPPSRLAPPILPARVPLQQAPPTLRPKAPLRPAPPIPPPRNPKRLGLTSRSPERVAQIWDPTLGAYIPRQPTGGFARITKTNRTSTTTTTGTSQPLQRSLTTNTLRQRAPLLIPTTNQHETIGRSLHDQIETLRQSYIDLQADDVFAPRASPGPPPRRSASVSSMHVRSPVRNFSLPTYSPSKKQQVAPTPAPVPAPPRLLRRVRSRSVNLGPVAEASELPDLPVWRESINVAAVSDQRQLVDESEFDQVLSFQLPESMTTTATTTIATEPETNPESDQVLSFQLPGSTTMVASTAPPTETVSKHTTPSTAVLEPKSSEGTCNCCGSTRKALAMNPTCCIAHAEERGRVCFRCWSDRLAESLSKTERKDWLCCLLCEKRLVVGDVKRLAGRGTLLR